MTAGKRVYLDDREIGFHEFSVRERDGREPFALRASGMTRSVMT